MQSGHVLLAVVLTIFTIIPNRPASAAEADDEQAVRQWIETWGDRWSERYHPDYDAQYPGGRSNRFHDKYIGEALKRLADTATGDWKIFNKHYMYDRDWFVVEWIYESTQTSTGLVQRESTVAFGRIVDDRLKIWIEYFDDMVGAYQWIGAMPLYGDEEMPYPWPEKTPLRRDYRP